MTTSYRHDEWYSATVVGVGTQSMPPRDEACLFDARERYDDHHRCHDGEADLSHGGLCPSGSHVLLV